MPIVAPRRILPIAAAFTVAAALAAGASGCATHAAVPTPASPLPEVETTLILIGDAGAPSARDPVLRALGETVARDPARTVVVFLGDNIYPAGLPPPGRPGRKEAERRLAAQIDAVRERGGRAVFVPGNHDWEEWRPGGWEAVRRQGDFIAERGGTAISMLPAGGCPGPVVKDVETRLRLVVLDTQWWLHEHQKPEHPTSTCPEDSEEEILAALRQAIESAGDRRVVVVGHHPLASGGTHGGYFSWRDHVFPLRAKRSWLWIPLPGVGSAYPMARRRGVTQQDLSGPLNVKMRAAIEGVFEQKAPLVYAAGHEHNLQVLKGKDVKYLLVSGAGYFGHVSRTVTTESTLFARVASGFMRLDFAADGDVRLSAVTVDVSAKATESFSMMIK